MSIEHFSNFVGHVGEKYKPCDLSLTKDNILVFTQSYVIGWKKKGGIGDIYIYVSKVEKTLLGRRNLTCEFTSQQTQTVHWQRYVKNLWSV